MAQANDIALHSFKSIQFLNNLFKCDHKLQHCPEYSGVNLAGILWDASADIDGLVRGER